MTRHRSLKLTRAHRLAYTRRDAGSWKVGPRGLPHNRTQAGKVALGLGNPGGYDPEDLWWQNQANGWMWHLIITKADLAWNMTRGDPDVLVAVVDAGFQADHAELVAKMDPLDPSSGFPLLDHYHGTAVAAMAAAETAEVGSTANGPPKRRPGGAWARRPSRLQQRRYGPGWGTSFSAPMVTGAVGLIKSVNACLRPDDVQTILKNSTDPIVDAANYPSEVGTGRLNVNRAVALAQSKDYACPQGGWFDSANCYMGSAPSGATPFVDSGNYYYTPLHGVDPCPLPGSWFDSENCYVMPVPEDVTPFVWGGNWYYSDCSADGWTDWLNRDAPSGTGDWEVRSLFTGVCAQPQAIQCRATDGTYWTQTGDVDLTCDRDTGLSCENADQADNLCEDYEVRFFCP